MARKEAVRLCKLMDVDKKPHIKIKDLNVTYNPGKSNEVRVLRGINLDIYEREYLIIFGPSGCGKSTLLYSIAGLQKPTDGVIEMEGQDIKALTRLELAEFHRRKIGMIFQAFYLIDSLSLLDNVCLPKIFTEEEEAVREENGKKLLERFGILAQAEKYSSELSGGQKQRAAIARSLINDPEIILADEPVGNLDSTSAFNVMSILSDLNKTDKKTVILVTHDPAHLPYGDRVVHMKDGKIVKIEEILDKKIPKLASEEWELVSRRPGEEIVKVKKAEGEEIFKINREDGEEIVKIKRGDEWVMVRRGTVSPEIAMLMRAFKNFSVVQLGMLFVPFKAQELFSHIVFNTPDEFLEVVKRKIQEVLSGNLSMDQFLRFLDLDRGKGGAGWDKRRAEHFTSVLKRICDQSAEVDFSKADDSAALLTRYMVENFSLILDEAMFSKFKELMKRRLVNVASVDDVQKELDLPVSKGGFGFDKRTAFKVTRELEVILLLKFSA
ncbi:MAG: ABC transporter ATP-binding protein [Patescibacteria group bacterium]|nr:ABC transporter ATP-binding protein [Patescibacteria group bacterium]